MGILWFLALFISVFAFSGDDLASRKDLYGPAATQWNYSALSSTTTVKATTGVLHCVTIASAPANNWSVRDGNTVTSPVVISSFPASAQVGTYCYDIATSSGIQVVMPASGLCSVTLSYR